MIALYKKYYNGIPSVVQPLDTLIIRETYTMNAKKNLLNVEAFNVPYV